ncbi:MAG: NAD(P)/FAD-dependent oxidoreductase [Synechococcales cyanobacterium RM1_1_8]|nr:NAD(P)/FAD-dependent oxidoreductase [Synechococcales cyanobacterium RM1_1_8]
MTQPTASTRDSTSDSTSDIIVIGSGIGGLSCAALLTHYGYRVTVCESHSIPGGAAHGFERQGFKFDSGPSLYSGLSQSPSPNPLGQVLDAVGESLDWVNYDTWGCLLPEGEFDTQVGAEQFATVLERLRGAPAVAEWRALQRLMEPYAQAAVALPVAALRPNLGALWTVGRSLPNLLPHLSALPRLTGPFSALIDPVVTDPFLRNWLQLLSFLISGLPAEGTSAAAMAFMFADWYRPNVQLDYPRGGSAALVAALVRAIRKSNGSQVRLSTHVSQVLVDQGRTVGVRLGNGDKLLAKVAVVANTSLWNTLKLLPQGSVPQRFVEQRQAIPTCDSFMHLHLGIHTAGLSQELLDGLACHYIQVNDWALGITAPQNVVLISIPSLLDPSLAPAGKHSIHAYTPGNEPFELWQGLDPKGEAYGQLKQARSQCLWRALERIIPDIRQRCEVELVGTPLTHRRFLRRHRGSYGPALAAGQASFPGPLMPLKNLYCCGDSTFPGIGLPAVAASGMVAAHAIAPVSQQLKMLRQLAP